MKALFRWILLCSLAFVGPLWGAEEPLPPQRPTPADFTLLVEHPDTLVLTNTSDRPIIAWMVRTVTRSSQGYEAKTSTGVDAYRAGIFPPGVDDGVLGPGESVTLPKAKPWLREDHRGPGASVRHDVGLVAFGVNEVIGDPDLVEDLFKRRLDLARQAAAALDALNSNVEKLRELPTYWRVFGYLPDREEAIQEIRKRAREDYRVAFDHLRPQDRVVLERERKQQ